MEKTRLIFFSIYISSCDPYNREREREYKTQKDKQISISYQHVYSISITSMQVDNEEEIWGMCSSGRGQIQISLSYCTRRRALLVTIHRAMNLLPMDNNGFSDPFVKLALVEDATDNHRQQRFLDYSSTARATARKLKKTAGRNSQSTSIKRKTLNPEWNEEFVFATRLTELMKLTLCLSVWDKDFGKSNDYLGSMSHY